MARIVIKDAQGPHEVPPNEKSVFICMCELSKNQPFCDGSHKKTKDEEAATTYRYKDDGTREVVAA